MGQGTLERVPNGLVHAKRIGSARVACGETSSSWQVFWTAAFPDESAGVTNCAACLAVVRPAPRKPKCE